MTLPPPLIDGIDPPDSSFVVQDRKIVYVSVANSASTAMLWMIADLAGEDLESFHESLGAQPSRRATIHGARTRWKRAVALSELPAEQLADISVDDGWFVFAVVQDPWSRFWSAWQSGLPSVASSQEQVLKDFRNFLDAEPWAHDPRLSRAARFHPQVHAVQAHDVSCSRVYDADRLDELLTDLRTHLAAVGRPVAELFLPPVDQDPLALIPAVLEDGAAEIIAELYADDFGAYGDRWSVERLRSGPDTWSDDALKHAAYLAVANERIGDLSKQALTYKRRWRRAVGHNRGLRRQLVELQDAKSLERTRPSPGRRLVRRVRALGGTR